MVDDVIDIRKRIEKIRNEVSEAIVFQKDVNLPNEDINSDVSFSLDPGKESNNDFKLKELSEKSNSKNLDTEKLKSTHRGIIHSMSLPSFNLIIPPSFFSGIV